MSAARPSLGQSDIGRPGTTTTEPNESSADLVWTRSHGARRRSTAAASAFKIAGALLALICCTTIGADADKTSGDWTGAVELRGNYYWETSTRVVAPALNLELEAPNGVRLRADYLVDSITSASQAAGAIVDRRFTEIRHDVGVGGGYEFEVAGNPLDISLNGRFSSEPDYVSLSGGINAALSLNQRSTVFRLSLNMLHDSVGSVLRGSNAAGDPAAMDQGEIGTLDAIVTSLGWEQVFSPTLVLTLGYDLGILNGFIQNVYRSLLVQGAGAPMPEQHPDSRTRHTVHARLAWYIPATSTALHFMFRGYIDSWDIGAITPEARIYQEIGDAAQIRLRYRHYRQTSSFFYRQPLQYSITDPFRTADPKMSAFVNQLLGFQFLLRMEFLRGTALAAFADATADLSFEYIWSTNSFGNAVVSQVGLRVPF